MDSDEFCEQARAAHCEGSDQLDFSKSPSCGIHLCTCHTYVMMTCMARRKCQGGEKGPRKRKLGQNIGGCPYKDLGQFLGCPLSKVRLFVQKSGLKPSFIVSGGKKRRILSWRQIRLFLEWYYSRKGERHLSRAKLRVGKRQRRQTKPNVRQMLKRTRVSVLRREAAAYTAETAGQT